MFIINFVLIWMLGWGEERCVCVGGGGQEVRVDGGEGPVST
jgi:hypothetical protein